MVLILAGGALASSAALANDGAVLLSENFTGNTRGWTEDAFSRFEGGGYVIEARGKGGYARWIENPADLRDFRYSARVTLDHGEAGAGFGLLFRVREDWRNSYFFLVDATGRYSFGKFVAGKRVVVKTGLAAAGPPAPDAPLELSVEAQGTTFRLAVGAESVGAVRDETFPQGGRIGLYCDAPVTVRFQQLLVTALGDNGGAARPRTLFADRFEQGTGWPLNDFGRLENGAYHLANHGQAKRFAVWNPNTADLTDFVARVDVRQITGLPDAFFGLLWRVQDADHYYFFVLNPDGRYYAGLQNGAKPIIHRQGTVYATRPGSASNSLEVRVDGGHCRIRVNGSDACAFDDATYSVGALGFYLQQPADVAFSDLLVTDLPERTPPPVGGSESGAPTPPAVGSLLFSDRLALNDDAEPWPVDDNHAFDQGGYCLRAPRRGSLTALRGGLPDYDDGVFAVTTRSVVGPVQGGSGLVWRAAASGDSFYFLLLSGAGEYYVGKCLNGRYTVLDSGPASDLRGGDAGNSLQVEAHGPLARYSVNDHLLGTFHDDSLARGRLGLHVENGVTACFRDLCAYRLPAGSPAGAP
jgi:hypothetical protein